ncbi:MAG: SUMF1/EgtB/PvdO family nonheme iron enzyme [Paludibacter sp.]|nr:SUMF1/EgtB/PvdO family nonheme iron enzyme [Paludibacter sp.]
MINAKNVVILDKETGIPSIMVKFEKPNYKNEKDKAAVPPMFIIGGQEVDAIYISKYPNVMIGGRAYSLPMQEPMTEVTFDEAVKACRAKGEGWHLMTAVEWEYLLDQSRAKDTMPHGNTRNGSDYYNKEEHGDMTGCSYGRTLTGSGPVTWNHDHTIYGVSDMCGNVWEWLAGLRLMEGNIEHIPNNDAALYTCDLSRDSKEWKGIEIDGKAVRFKVEDGEICITAADEQDEPNFDGLPWRDLQVELSEIPEVLKNLGVVPKGEQDNKAYVWIDTEGERLAVRGSSFGNASSSGPSALYLDDVRSISNDDVGFRSAFYEVNGKLITE